MFDRDYDPSGRAEAGRRASSARGARPLRLWDRDARETEVVLLEAGVTPWLVAAVLEDVMGIKIPNPLALEGATPLVLFRELDRSAAEDLVLRLDLAGAEADLRSVRPRSRGFRFRLAA